MEVGGKAVTTAYSGVASDTGAEMTLAYDGGGAGGGWQLAYSGSGALHRELSEDGAGQKVGSSTKDRIKRREKKGASEATKPAIRQNASTSSTTVSTRKLAKSRSPLENT